MKNILAFASSFVLVLLLALGDVGAQANPISIKFSELYSKSKTQELSPKLLAANGKRVEMPVFAQLRVQLETQFFAFLTHFLHDKTKLFQN